MRCLADVAGTVPRALAQPGRHVSARDVTVAAPAVLLLLTDPDQWPAAQRPSITPGAGCELYEAEIPAPTPRTASLAESVMGVWAAPHPRRRCLWEGTRVQAQVRDLAHSLAAADTFSDGQEMLQRSQLPPAKRPFLGALCIPRTLHPHRVCNLFWST